MNNEGWFPLFNKIVHSSLWAEPDYVVKIFITMLALKDRKHIVSLSAFAIGEVAKKTEREVLDAFEILSAPDTKRIEKQPFDGRRIERTERGWLILNGPYYQSIMNEMSVRAQKARWAKDHRKGKPEPGSATNQRLANNGATQEQLDRHQAGIENHKPRNEPKPEVNGGPED